MVGGYLLCNILSSGVEASIFSYAMAQTIRLADSKYRVYAGDDDCDHDCESSWRGYVCKDPDLVAFLLVGSMIIMGLIGMFKLGTGQVVSQPYTMATKPSELFSATATAFWLFIGAEYVIPVSKSVKNAKRNVPLGMIIGLALICGVQSIMVFGFIIILPGRS